MFKHNNNLCFVIYDRFEYLGLRHIENYSVEGYLCAAKINWRKSVKDVKWKLKNWKMKRIAEKIIYWIRYIMFETLEIIWDIR